MAGPDDPTGHATETWNAQHCKYRELLCPLLEAPIYDVRCRIIPAKLVRSKFLNHQFVMDREWKKPTRWIAGRRNDAKDSASRSAFLLFFSSLDRRE